MRTSIAGDTRTDDAKARRKPANLTVNAELLRQARMLNINLSATLEDALVRELSRRKRERWLESNHEAISHYNESVSRDGVYSDSIRTF